MASTFFYMSEWSAGSPMWITDGAGGINASFEHSSARKELLAGIAGAPEWRDVGIQLAVLCADRQWELLILTAAMFMPA